MSNPQEQKRVDIVKVSFMGKIKRIYNPSKDLKCLTNQIRSHFKELNGFAFGASQQLGKQEFSLQYMPSADCQITVSTNEQMDDIYKEHTSSVDNKIPRFDVNINTQLNGMSQFHRNSEIMNSVVLESSQPNDQSQVPNDQNEMRESMALENNLMDKGDKFYENIASQESDEAESEDVSSQSSNEEKDEQMLLYKLRHVVRLEVEKEAITLFDGLNGSPIKENENPLAIRHQEEEKVRESQVIDVSVNISPSKTESKRFPLINKFKSMFQKKLGPGDHLLLAKNIGQNDFYQDAQPGKNCEFKWQLQNQSACEWPKNIELVQIYSWPPTQVANMPLDLNLQPNDIKEIVVTVNIPEDIVEPYHVVMFKMQDKETRLVGQPLTAFIKVALENDEEPKPREGIDAEDFPKHKLDDEQLLGMASILLDEGFGSFDRCYNLIRCLRGDIKKARDVLSQLIFQESQF